MKSTVLKPPKSYLTSQLKPGKFWEMYLSDYVSFTIGVPNKKNIYIDRNQKQIGEDRQTGKASYRGAPLLKINNCRPGARA